MAAKESKKSRKTKKHKEQDKEKRKELKEHKKQKDLKEKKEPKKSKKPPKPKKPTIDAVLARYPRHPQHLIALLQDVQAAFTYISPENLDLICDYLEVPVAQAWSIATFYKSFSLEPRGEHEIKVCLGTTCHLKGGERLVEGCERDLHVERGQTTEDQRFSLDTVKCVGACAEAPVVMVDQEYLGQASLISLKEYLKKL